MNAMATDDKNGQGQAFQIDLTDATYCELAKYADRIARLLESQKAKSNHALAASLDDFLGVVYALILAKKYEFKDRSSCPIQVGVVIKRAKDLAKGMVRTDGVWMAGLHFNSALYRTSAVSHRLLKPVVGKDDKLKKLLPAAEVLYRKWTGNKWNHGNTKGIHDEVNDLKHTPKGIHDGRRPDAGFQNGLSAVGELLDLVEAWAGPSTT
jgi:hypothetical protein